MKFKFHSVRSQNLSLLLFFFFFSTSFSERFVYTIFVDFRFQLWFSSLFAVQIMEAIILLALILLVLIAVLVFLVVTRWRNEDSICFFLFVSLFYSWFIQFHRSRNRKLIAAMMIAVLVGMHFVAAMDRVWSVVEENMMEWALHYYSLLFCLWTVSR